MIFKNQKTFSIKMCSYDIKTQCVQIKFSHTYFYFCKPRLKHSAKDKCTQIGKREYSQMHIEKSSVNVMRELNVKDVGRFNGRDCLAKSVFHPRPIISVTISSPIECSPIYYTPPGNQSCFNMILSHPSKRRQTHFLDNSYNTYEPLLLME